MKTSLMIVFFVFCMAIFSPFFLFFTKFVIRRRRAGLPFPESWKNILRENVPLYRKIPAGLRKELHVKMNIFLSEKTFESASDMQIDDRIRLTIAFFASLLLLNKKSSFCYPDLSTVIVYPEAYEGGDESYAGLQLIKSENVFKLGESWDNGMLVLSWQELSADAAGLSDGENVAIHEFAHQLDVLGNLGDLLNASEWDAGTKAEWKTVLRKEYDELCRKSRAGIDDVIDDYGSENESEFFAVATEAFFCRSVLFRQLHPKLYKQFEKFYNLSPAKWDLLRGKRKIQPLKSLEG